MTEIDPNHLHENLIFIHKNEGNCCNGRDISSSEEEPQKKHFRGSSFFFGIIILATGVFIGFFCSSHILGRKYKLTFDSISADFHQSNKDLQQNYADTLAKIEKQLDKAKKLGSECYDENLLMRKKLKTLTKTEQSLKSMNSSYLQTLKEKKEVTEKLEVATKDLEAKKGQVLHLERTCKESGNNHLSGYTNQNLEKILDKQAREISLLNEKRVKYENLVETMKEDLSHSSLRRLNQRYGKGPHRVLVDVVLTQDDSQVRGSFTVELAPNEMMPYTVLTFLDMVSSGIYEGCSFFYSADHVLMIGDKNSDPIKEKRIQTKIEKMSFSPALFYQEHNPNYPHEEMTLGFSARQLGPSFYISKIDNTELHGRQKALDEFDFPPQEGEPCFGKVVAGVNVVHEIDSLTPSKNHPVKNLVEIESITLLTEHK